MFSKKQRVTRVGFGNPAVSYTQRPYLNIWLDMLPTTSPNE